MRQGSWVARAGAANFLLELALRLVPVVLVAIMWWPALFAGRTLIHGDAMEHGMPLFVLLSRWLAGHGSLAWAPAIYGGHPVFAEGQGAFAEPLNLVFAGVVLPLVGALPAMNLFHVATMLLGALGMYLLARRVGLGAWASLFAVVAVMVSPGWVNQQQNMTMSGSLLWIPWCLWAVEVWVARPAAATAVLLGVTAAGTVLAGYPQTLHAILLMWVARVVAAPPVGWRADWRRIGASLALGGAVGLGLAAVQLLPLLQLVGLSHRAAGVGLVMHEEGAAYLRGLLYSPGDPYAFPATIGSALVALLAVLGVALGGRMARGQAACVLLMVLLGIETVNPLFPLFYQHGLVPGLRYFRIMQIYVLAACPGLALLAGMGLERWAAGPPGRRGMLALGAAAVLVAGAAGAATPAPTSILQLGIAVLGVAVLAGVPRVARSRTGLVLPVVTVLLVAETVVLRLRPFPFFAPALAAEPDTAVAIKAMPDWRDYRVYDATYFGGFSLASPYRADYVQLFTGAQRSLVGMTAARWGIGSLNGALALALARRDAVEPLLFAEAAGQGTAPGARLIDALAVREITRNGPCTAPAFTALLFTGTGPYLCQNRAARPTVQLYERHREVGSAAEALAVVQSAGTADLVVENPGGAQLPADAAGGGSVRVVKAAPTDMRVLVSARAPVWLFVADAPYPGWRATIDGAAAPLLPAQVLGRAVPVPAGTHVVEIRFTPWAMLAGAAVTGFTLVALAGWAVARR